MRRGDIIIAAPLPPFDKPRPALVVQSALLGQIETITVALITSDLSWPSSFRVAIAPSGQNGLKRPSQVMVDLLVTFPLARLGGVAGVAEAEVMERVDGSLRLFLGL